MWDAQSVGISSLNHGSTISFGFNLTTPFFQKITPHLHRCYSVRVHCTYIYICHLRVHPYAHLQHMKVLKHFIYV